MKKKDFKISKAVLLAYLVFLSVNAMYFYFITVNWEFVLSNDGGNAFGIFHFVLNGDSLKAYFPDLEMLINGTSEQFRFGNSISYLYYALWLIFPYDLEDVVYLAFIANNIAIVVAYIFFSKIGREVLGLNMRYRWLYFLNPVLIFSSQMISKEAFLFAGVAVICYYSMTRKFWIPALTSIFVLLVRSPFALLWPLMRFVFLSRRKVVKVDRLFAFSILLLIFSGYYASLIPFDSYTELHDAGITRITIQYNYLYLGPLLLAPLKLIASFYDLASTALWQSLDDGYVIVYYAINLPIVVFLALRIRELIYLVTHPICVLRSSSGCIFSFVVIYFVIVIGNIFIHSRYMWPIMPILILLLYSIRHVSFSASLPYHLPGRGARLV